MTNSNGQEIGIINEIGDLGLGFEPITEEEAEKLKETKEEK